MDVRGEAPAARLEVETLVREMDFNAGVNQLSKIRPVLEVPGASIDLVDDDAFCFSLSKTSKHLGKQGTAALRGRLAFFKPRQDRQAVALGVLAVHAEQRSGKERRKHS